jgi:hypothetical protein
MRLVSGRLFNFVNDAHGQPHTIIVNDALAHRYFPRGHAVGSQLDMGDKWQIVGVVHGIEDSPADLESKPAFWFPLEQHEDPAVFFAVRTTSPNPLSITPAVGAAVHSVDSELALANIQSLENRAEAATASRRFALWLLQAFAALALILAAAGIYALLAYIVQQRSKELGIRAALGASRRDLWTMILSDGMKLTSAGVLGSIVIIPFGGSLMQRFLYNVKSFDLPTITGTSIALLAVAVLASLAPARAAMRSDPARTLRED